MSFIDDILGKLFPQKQLNLTYKENFIQTAEEEDEVSEWVNSLEGKEAIGKVYRNFHLKKAGINDSPEVHILNSPYANGFAISFEKPFDEKIFSRLFFAFGQRLLDLGYRRVSLDRKMQEVNDMVKITEKLYYKPPVSASDFSEKIDQLFGNVSIEKVSVDNKPSFLKVLVTIYSDHLYREAKPFDQFVEGLLT
jgi:hypothetical protein